ncbi:Uncharacterised protein [Vibrio cholerae]|nr:Uncharacterised protein [Vibrio cholerae]
MIVLQRLHHSGIGFDKRFLIGFVKDWASFGLTGSHCPATLLLF